MIPYATLRPGPGFQPGRAALYYSQRLVIEARVRRSVARILAATIRLRHGRGSWDALGSRHAGVLPALRDQGLAVVPGLVDEAAADRLLQHFLRSEVMDREGRPVPLDRLPAGTAMAAYPLRTLLECPDVLALVNAAPVLRIVAEYLGCKPTLSSLGARWSFPSGKAPSDTQLFHRDPDDWRFVKLFVYLTGVDAESGPHSYVMQSHRTAGQIRARPYDRAAIERRYGRHRISTVTGPSGTAFMADTWGIHAGMIPTRAPRLMLQAQYSLLPIFALRYEPLALQAASGFDPYVNRLLVAGGRAA